MSVRDFGDPVRLTSPDGLLEAEFLPKLGMVGRSLRHEGEELLGQRGGPAAYAEQKATFGIPLLHPWANRLGDWRYEQAGQRVTLDRESPVLKADPRAIRSPRCTRRRIRVSSPSSR
jgi:aldose 1-epimerase